MDKNKWFKCDEPDFELLSKSPDPFYLNGSDCTTSNGFKMKGASEPNELCDIFRPSDFDDKALLRSSMDFDKKADVVTSCCPIQDITAASILMEPSTDELFSLINEDDECSKDLQKSESVFPSKLHRMLENAEKDGLESFRRQLNIYELSRVNRGASRGVCYYQMFIHQSDTSLCQSINRPRS